jgi:hypothetical protein
MEERPSWWGGLQHFKLQKSWRLRELWYCLLPGARADSGRSGVTDPAD